MDHYTLSTPPTDGRKKTGCQDSVAIDSQMLGLIFGTLLGDYSTIYVRPTSSAPLSQASAAEGRNCRLLDEVKWSKFFDYNVPVDEGLQKFQWCAGI